MKRYRGISEQHVEAAILELLTYGYPAKNESTGWDLITDSGETLPPKLVLKGAATKAGVTDSIADKGGGWPTNDILELLGCTIKHKGKSGSKGKPASELSNSELRSLAEAKGTKSPKVSTIETNVRDTRWAIAEYVKRMADGRCDLCTSSAPFTVNGMPFLECHHIIPLAEDGPHEIDNAVALCPNCHRKMHLVKDIADTQRLWERAAIRC